MNDLPVRASGPGDALERFSEPTRLWFLNSFAAPTAAQADAWRVVASGDDALVIAPTGSGKTLAAFLWAIDRLATSPIPEPKKRLRVLYISPLKALAADIERNLRSPLAGIGATCARLGALPPDITVGVRTGDTPEQERRRFASHPPDILITTPESLFLLVTARSREALRNIDVVIVDEVHSLAGGKRGAHLALSLERLDELTGSRAQRIGLSATVRPPEEVARWLGGIQPVSIVHPPSAKELDLSVTVPVEDLGAMGDPAGEPHEGSAAGAEARNSIWPHVEQALLELIQAHRSTIVFANSRRLSERLCARLNELAGKEVARAHHGSVSREQRTLIEESLKAGTLPAVVATSSLELGIDMGAVDLVVQVEAPDSVASGLQRIGRAGHQVGAVSRGVLFPKFRGDLLECAVVVERMKSGAIESIAYPRNPLDVLAQQIVAMVAMDDWDVTALEGVVKRAAPFADLPRDALMGVLDMLTGRYPSDDFAELRPRLNWDRTTDLLSARPNAQRLAVTSGGTIPDRGLFGVFLAGERAPRVGELDEEMVYESRPGETFVLGASTWLIEDITHDRVLVSPAPGQTGKMPFWHGDAAGRPIELGRAIGAFIRELSRMSLERQRERLEAAGFDDSASNNLIAYLKEQKEATGVLPDDRTIVVERFRDELGDWRLCIHSMFGAQVHAPWAQAIEGRVRERLGVEVQTMYTDDGIVIRIPETDESPAVDSVVLDPEEVADIVVSSIGTSALFASRFRECAARALLLPKRRPGTRTPLWQQRQRSANLLQVAGRYPSFPIMLETYRECLRDVFDVPALTDLMAAVQRREVKVVEVETGLPSPFASSLQFGYVMAFMYEGDAPLAERRAQALSLDRALLAELMGQEELRDLIDEDSLVALELDLQLLSPRTKIRQIDGLHDALRSLGDLTVDEVAARVTDKDSVATWLGTLQDSHRALEVRMAGESRWIAIEDAARVRDALGVALPVGVPGAFLEPVADPLGDLVARWARTHGPFASTDVAARLGLGRAVVESALARLQAEGRVAAGRFRPGGSGAEWIGIEVLRTLRRRSLAAFRKEIEPVSHSALVRFSLAWQSIGVRLPENPVDAVYGVIAQLQGAPIAASALESSVLPARVPGYTPGLIDQLTASGEVVWAGNGAIGSDDGWIVLATADRAAVLLPDVAPAEVSDTAARILEVLSASGAMFWRQLADAAGSVDDSDLLEALWELVWAGLVTNDTLAPVRALGAPRVRRGSHRGPARRRPPFPSRQGPPSAAGRWSLVPEPDTDSTRRAHAVAGQLLERYGVVTRGPVVTERVPGGFAAVYPVFKAMEESGHCKRGYFVDGLGGAQFAEGGAVDRLRSFEGRAEREMKTHVLAATDTANPFGAAIPWPERGDDGAPGAPEDGASKRAPGGARRGGLGHRPARKTGALVVIADGDLVLYVEKGGRTVLSFSEDPALLQPAVDALALAARDGLLGRLTVERADGEPVDKTPLAAALTAAGFRPTSRGLRLRG